jgi:hypothetical protein
MSMQWHVYREDTELGECESREASFRRRMVGMACVVKQYNTMQRNVIDTTNHLCLVTFLVAPKRRKRDRINETTAQMQWQDRNCCWVRSAVCCLRRCHVYGFSLVSLFRTSGLIPAF